MNKPADGKVAEEAVDRILKRLADYAANLRFEDIPADTVYAAKVRIIDTFGALMAGYSDEPSVIARGIASDVPSTAGATIIGTNIVTTPDLAAFANGTASRSAEMNDHDRKPGGRNGHPSDVVMPVYSAAEYVRANGRDFITAVILAYEVYMRFQENIGFVGFDSVTFCGLGSAAAAGKLMGLSPKQLAQCISMIAINNNPLNQTRAGQLSMWKAMAGGYAGRAGVFAAMLARRGMEGPQLPFEGKYGWCKNVAQKELVLDKMGGNGEPFRVQDTVIKPRSACFHTLSPILAAEKAAAVLKGDIENIKHVTVEIYGAHERTIEKILPGVGGGGHHWWHPDSRESADHSTPYAVTATLIDGTVTKNSFDDAHLWNPKLRALLAKVELIENPEFTAAYERRPVQHCTRVTVIKSSGDKIVGEYGGKHGNLSDKWPKEKVEEKFSRLSSEKLGADRVRTVLDELWNLENINDVSVIAKNFA